MKRRRSSPGTPRRIPAALLLLLAAGLTAVVLFMVWPLRHGVQCEQLPQLVALALCGAVLFIPCALTIAQPAQREDRLLAGSAAVLCGLTLFLAAHYVTIWHKPCLAVQQQVFSN